MLSIATKTVGHIDRTSKLPSTLWSNSPGVSAMHNCVQIMTANTTKHRKVVSIHVHHHELGRPSFVFDRVLGPKNGPEDFAGEPNFLCRVCDTGKPDGA